jgi:CRP/FNR family cyclic AMP-dependent transcriptional regulator
MTERQTGALLTIEKVLALKQVGLFALIPEEDLIEVAYIATEVHADAGERIMSEGEMGSSMFAIVNGRVRVHSGGREIAMLAPGEVVGELATLDPEPRSADVTAVEDTLLLRIDSSALSELMSEQAAVASSIIAVLCRRLRATDKAISLPAAPRSSTTIRPAP